MIRWLTVTVAALVCAVAASSTALAANPYRFKDTAKFEKGAALTFETIARKNGFGRQHVLSIGCAKGGVGRAYCAVVAAGRSSGVGQFTYRIECASDSGVDCTGFIEEWPK